jgi:Xaa-Pro aminopeptidase
VPNPYAERRRRLAALLEEARLPALAVSHLPNIRYLTGFSGSNGVLLAGPGNPVLFTDPRYDIQAREETGLDVRVLRGPLWPEVAKTVARRKLGAVAVESDRVSHQTWLEFTKALDGSARLKAQCGLVEGLRSVKSEAEIEAIRLSARCAMTAFERAIKRVKPGVREREIAAELDYQMRKAGAEGPAFETIVAAGPRSALPHARPGGERVGTGQLLLVDMGACREGYASDLTRMLHLGEPGARARELHAAVLAAQLAGLEAVRDGVACSAVDGAARRSLRRHKLDEAFTHSTGHGLGLEIHEGPRLGQKSTEHLAAGMVVTIEPGAYVEGFGGVRIEDTVVVRAGGAEILTTLGKELLVLET